MRGFVGFIIYAENSVPEYPNGHFVTENLPPGVEVVDCSNLLVSYITNVVLQSVPKYITRTLCRDHHYLPKLFQVQVKN